MALAYKLQLSPTPLQHWLINYSYLPSPLQHWLINYSYLPSPLQHWLINYSYLPSQLGLYIISEKRQNSEIPGHINKLSCTSTLRRV